MILVTGSNGFLGSHLVERISKNKLSLLDRGQSKHSNQHRFQQAEINSYADYSNSLRDCDTVIHCAARVHVMEDSAVDPLQEYREVNTSGTINLAKQAVKAGVKRFIFISSIKVNGENSPVNRPFTEKDAHAFEDNYGRSKSEAEVALQELSKETGLEVVIIRPTLVYGSGVKGNFYSLMRLVNKGIPLPFKLLSENKRSLVSVSNLVDLIITCISHPKAANQVFLVSDDDDISTSQMAYLMARSLGQTTVQLPVPVAFFRLAARLAGKGAVIDRLAGSLQVDISHTKKTLDWSPPQTVEEGFRDAVKPFLNIDIE